VPDISTSSSGEGLCLSNRSETCLALSRSAARICFRGLFLRGPFFTFSSLNGFGIIAYDRLSANEAAFAGSLPPPDAVFGQLVLLLDPFGGAMLGCCSVKDVGLRIETLGR